jgi:hypothetical protein
MLQTRLKYTSILLLIVFGCISTLYAQEFELKGQFTGKNLEKSFINVINTSTYKATISQLDGKFKIPVAVGDSILISSIQYKEVKFIVKAEYKSEAIEIPLKLKINELAQVDVYSLGLTGDLNKDAGNIKTNEFNQRAVGLPAPKKQLTKNERRLYAAKSSAGGIPLDYVFNLINGNIKMYKQLIKYDQIDNQEAKLGRIFPERFYTEDLNLPDNLVEDFVYYCVEQHPATLNLMKQQNTLELYEVLPGIADEYLKLKEGEKDKTKTIDY